jgi:hypothetical protein
MNSYKAFYVLMKSLSYLPTTVYKIQIYVQDHNIRQLICTRLRKHGTTQSQQLRTTRVHCTPIGLQLKMPCPVVKERCAVFTKYICADIVYLQFHYHPAIVLKYWAIHI